VFEKTRGDKPADALTRGASKTRCSPKEPEQGECKQALEKHIEEGPSAERSRDLRLAALGIKNSKKL